MSNPFVRHEEAAPISDVNVVPLADVSLVLLIILLVLSPMAAQSMLRVQAAAAKVESTGPKAGEDPLEPKAPEPVLAIGLTPLGYVMDGRLLGGDAELKALLEPLLKHRDDKKVFLSPELDEPNGRVVTAIEIIQNCGASAVALVQVVDPLAGDGALMAKYALMRLRAQTPEAEPVTEVNIIPVIDISLVLLVILFVTAPLLSYPTLPVDLPPAHQPPNQDLTIAVTYAKDGALSVRAANSSWDKLVPDLGAEVAKRKDSIVLLRVDQSVPYRTVQRLIAAAKSSGAKSIALATEPIKP